MSKPRKQQHRKPKGRPISGWLILDKPLDFGSTEAVSKIKWLFNAQKAGPRRYARSAGFRHVADCAG